MTYLVGPSLIDIYEENDIVSQCREAMQRGHLDRKRKKVINERIQKLVRHRFGRHVRYRLEPVVDVQTRDHHQEPICVDAADQRRDDEAVP